jgi:hypothetical protein
MSMVGQGESQPTEGVDALSDLAAALEPKDEQQAEAPAPDEAAGEEADETEVETEGEEAEGEEEAEEASFTITVDGKEETLTRSELIERAQKATDYTKKTMALAEERKALEPLKRQAEEVRQQVEAANAEAIARLEAYSKVIESQIGNPPSVDLAHRDPGAYLAQKELHESRKGQLQQALGEIRNLRDQQHRERQAALDRKAEATLKALTDTLPGFNDTKLRELGDYLRSAGITPEQHADAFVEKGLWEMASKAAAFDAIKAAQAKAKPAAPITKVAKPGAANPTGKAADRAKREAEFNKSPSVDTLARLLT